MKIITKVLKWLCLTMAIVGLGWGFYSLATGAESLNLIMSGTLNLVVWFMLKK